jgi:hypothetical protein
LLAVVTAAALAPFLHKAFYVDDPLFIWMAQQIVRHPLDSWVYLEGNEALVWLEGGLFATIAIGILALAATNLVQQKNSEALLLTLWVFGTFAFATWFNWSITARTLLPMAPAVAILTIAQFLQRQKRRWSKYALLLAAAMLPDCGGRLSSGQLCSLGRAPLSTAFWRRSKQHPVPGTLGLSVLHGAVGREAVRS